jgi:polar amino acid transport system substrate-binding protein
MKAHVVLALAACAFIASGCGSSPPPPAPVSVPPVVAKPADPPEVTTAPPTVGKTPPAVPNTDCGGEASLRPGPQPAPGAMPPGSTMAAIAERGRLVVGVDQNTELWGFRNPSTGRVEGFDIDLAREIARAIFGDPDRIDPRVVDAHDRESALTSGQVDLVVRTYTVTCERKKTVAFSTVYYYAHQKILSVKGSGIDSAAALGGKQVCAVSGTTSVPTLLALNPKPIVVPAANWTDCLVMLQQGQVDAISTDDAVLAGLVKQDPNMAVVGPSLENEPYGIGIKKENEDLVRFVNGALDRMRVDGTWQRLYQTWLSNSLGPSPGPPPPRYQDQP